VRIELAGTEALCQEHACVEGSATRSGGDSMSQVVVMLYKDKIPPSILKKLEAVGIIPVRTSYLSDVTFKIVEVPERGGSSNSANRTALSYSKKRVIA
jgi:hypothetical protein